MKPKCIIEYKNCERPYKRQAITQMFIEWQKCHPGDYIRVGIFNPSYSGLDLKIAEEMNLLHKDTKIIVFENFKYIDGKEYRSEYIFKKEIKKMLPMIPEENIYFHFGNIETLQLGAALYCLKEEKVNFAFCDFCGEIDYDIAKWFYYNSMFFEKNSHQFYTINFVKYRFTNEQQKTRLKFMNSFYQNADYNFINNLEAIKNQQKFSSVVNYWEANCATMLDTETKDYNDLISIENGKRHICPIIYLDKQIMGIFSSQCGEINQYYWEFLHSTLDRSFIEKNENYNENGIFWDSLKKSKDWNDAEIRLFRELPYPKEFNFNLQPFINKLKNGLGQEGLAGIRNELDKQLGKSIKAFYPNYVFEKALKSRYFHSSLHTIRATMIFQDYFLNQIVMDKSNGKLGRIVQYNPSGNHIRRIPYRFEYIEEKATSAMEVCCQENLF